MHFIQLLVLFLILSFGFNKSVAQIPYVTTFAGESRWGEEDGVSAKFHGPSGIAIDASGNVFVADQQNHLIRKISPNGVVSSVAGIGIAGFANGTRSRAKFNWPTGVAVDAKGNIYVADKGNNRIRKISPLGVVSTLAGSGEEGFANGIGKRAKFWNPTGVAVDVAGNVYVADNLNNRIRKISPSGMVSTLAGSKIGHEDGKGSSARFYLPSSLTLDASGNIYVAEESGVRKISPAGLVSTIAGNSSSAFADGKGSSARFNGPTGITIDPIGNLYVADYWNHRIRKIYRSGYVSTIAGIGTRGFADRPGTSAQFAGPSGITIDAAGNLYVADQDNHRIRKISIISGSEY